MHLTLLRDPETRIARADLAAPLFEESWQNRLTVAAANTSLEILSSKPTADSVHAYGEKMVNSLSQFLHGILASGESLACSPGCDHCCYQIVGATMPEVLLVLRFVLALPEQKRNEVEQGIALAASKAVGLAPKDRYSPEQPCPLLDGGRCQAYEARPLACRGVHALDAQICREILRNPVARAAFLSTGQGSPSYREPGRAVHALSAGMQLGLSEIYNLDMHPLDLTLALDRLLRDPQLIERWLRGQTMPSDIRAGHGSTSPKRFTITGELDPKESRR